MTRERTLEECLSSIASGNIAPGGGSSAAVVGAVGAATCENVCILSIEGEDGELAAVRDELRDSRGNLLDLAAEDERLVEMYFGNADVTVGQAELKELAEVPLSIAEETARVLEAATTVVAQGKENAVPDAIVGATLTDGALDAARFIVECNLPYIEDEDYVDSVDRRLAEVNEKATAGFDAIRDRRGESTR